jgi:hypothetical protein
MASIGYHYSPQSGHVCLIPDFLGSPPRLRRRKFDSVWPLLDLQQSPVDANPHRVFLGEPVRFLHEQILPLALRATCRLQRRDGHALSRIFVGWGTESSHFQPVESNQPRLTRAWLQPTPAHSCRFSCWSSGAGLRRVLLCRASLAFQKSTCVPCGEVAATGLPPSPQAILAFPRQTAERREGQARGQLPYLARNSSCLVRCSASHLHRTFLPVTCARLVPVRNLIRTRTAFQALLRATRA